MFRKRRKQQYVVASPVEVVPPYPEPECFNEIETEEWSGELPTHSVRMSVVFAYSDWCEFENSELFLSLLRYLSELRKRNNQPEMIMYREKLANDCCKSEQN